MSAFNTPFKHCVNACHVDFKQRLSESPIVDSLDMTDSVNLMVDQARSILIMLTCQFENPESRLSDEIIHGVIDAAIKNIDDIKAIVNAYYHTELDKQQA